MRLISAAVCALLLSWTTLQASPLDPPGDAKITKNEAEHIALKQFPGARVTAAKLEKAQGKLVWSLQIAPANAKAEEHVAVDAMSGRIVPSGAQEKP